MESKMTTQRSFRLTDKALQIIDKQPNKTEFVIEAILNADTVGEDESRCTRCKLVLPLICFSKHKKYTNGHDRLCKNCKAIKNSWERAAKK